MTDAKGLYLDLIKKALTFLLWDEAIRPINMTARRPFHKKWALNLIAKQLAKTGKHIVQSVPFDQEKRFSGAEWPPIAFAHTMIGMKRLDNLQMCIEEVIRNKVPGDLIETGVWRGGATIFMRAVLKAYEVTDRYVWAVDSFEGLPVPDSAAYPADEGDILHTFDFLRVSLEEVQANFARYNLLDDQVRFLKGWFRDTLPSAPIQRLAVMRLDGDMYESTMDALAYLYPKLSVGGYVIIDDYFLKGCRQAVHDFRARHEVADAIIDVDGLGAYWQSTKIVPA